MLSSKIELCKSQFRADVNTIFVLVFVIIYLSMKELYTWPWILVSTLWKRVIEKGKFSTIGLLAATKNYVFGVRFVWFWKYFTFEAFRIIISLQTNGFRFYGVCKLRLLHLCMFMENSSLKRFTASLFFYLGYLQYFFFKKCFYNESRYSNCATVYLWTYIYLYVVQVVHFANYKFTTNKTF